MLSILLSRKSSSSDSFDSKLYDESTFYPAFTKDINKCQSELIIESPFITCKRLHYLLPTLQKLKNRRVRIVINTKDPCELDNERSRKDAYDAISILQTVGIQVLYTAGHHRKLAIIDRKILYEGSLNILSQCSSCEVMRRVQSSQASWQMIRFIKIDRYF